MVKLRNCESKIQHKHQQCDEILSTFMKITRVNKLKNLTQCYEMLSTFMKITRVNSGAPDIHFFPVLHFTNLSGLQMATLRSKASSESI